MVSNPYVNKVDFAGSTLIDLTSDTVDASKVLYGESFHMASGMKTTGTAVLATASVSSTTLYLTNGFPVSVSAGS